MWVCDSSVYIEPITTVPTFAVSDFLHRLREPYIICLEFISNNPLWGRVNCDACGHMAEEILDKFELAILMTVLQPFLAGITTVVF